MSYELNFDPDHAIPDVTAIDVTVAFVDGGADYGLVIAKPLKGDERSIMRLRQKIENYVGDFYSEEAAIRYGTPKSGRMAIFIDVHKDSDPEVFEQLRQFQISVQKNGIALSWKLIETPGIQSQLN